MLGKTRREVEEMLKKEKVVELNLNERKPKSAEVMDDFRIYE